MACMNEKLYEEPEIGVGVLWSLFKACNLLHSKKGQNKLAFFHLPILFTFIMTCNSIPLLLQNDGSRLLIKYKNKKNSKYGKVSWDISDSTHKMYTHIHLPQ